MEILYIDRKSGKKCLEKVYGQKALSLLYGDSFLSKCLSPILVQFISKFPLISILYGFFQKTKSSAKKVAPFIKEYEIDSSEFVEKKFSSFNDFFIRKLKGETRPIDCDPETFVMPADGRYLVYPKFNDFVVKGKEFSIRQFLDSSELASRYADGSMAIIRLCPIDYHRFHFPCDGRASKARLINGFLYSVNPIALAKRISILSENKRMITEIQTERSGTVLYIEIGATSVGSIHQTYTPESNISKGQEKGYFEFGGSCIVLLFEKNRIAFDNDLITNTQNGLETRANFGQSLARST